MLFSFSQCCLKLWQTHFTCLEWIASKFIKKWKTHSKTWIVIVCYVTKNITAYHIKCSFNKRNNENSSLSLFDSIFLSIHLFFFLFFLCNVNKTLLAIDNALSINNNCKSALMIKIQQVLNYANCILSIYALRDFPLVFFFLFYFTLDFVVAVVVVIFFSFFSFCCNASSFYFNIHCSFNLIFGWLFSSSYSCLIQLCVNVLVVVYALCMYKCYALKSK